ncbi:MAG: hypothetical protein PWP25_1903 [Sphaerochaeta sp.]|nr:hypothetical protein [Sphaerochaeta sp.]
MESSASSMSTVMVFLSSKILLPFLSYHLDNIEILPYPCFHHDKIFFGIGVR